MKTALIITYALLALLYAYLAYRSENKSSIISYTSAAWLWVLNIVFMLLTN